MCVDLPPWSSAMSIEHPTHSTRTSLPERRNKWAAAGAGAAVGLLGGMIGLGGAEFRLPLLIGLFGFLALEAVILNKAMSLLVVATALPARITLRVASSTKAGLPIAPPPPVGVVRRQRSLPSGPSLIVT